MVLEDEGYRVLEAADGCQAIEMAGAESVDLIITDLEMPGMDSGDVIGAIRGHGTNVPVIAISGAFGRAEAAIDGVEAVLSKPVSPAVLVAKVAEVLKAR
jgi:CheY-like chemotaxis protein